MTGGKGIYISLWIILISLFTYLPDVYGENGRYENRKIEEIMGLLEKNHLNAKSKGEYGMGSICPGKNLVVTTDSRGKINHVGIKMFDRQIMADYPSPVYLFVERYLLWALLTKDEAAIQERLDEERVSIRFGIRLNEKIYPNLRQALGRIKPEHSFIITTDNSKYAITWLEEQRPILSVSFPIQYELIWGVNKKEAESGFQEDLNTYLSEGKRPFSDLSSSEMTSVRDSCFRSDGDFYGLEDITSYRYYRKNPDSTYTLIYNKAYPAESVANLFTGSPDPAVKIRVTQRVYGGKRELFTVPLLGFLSFCRDNGCDIFVGIEKQDEYTVTGTAIMVNRSLGYNHILYFNVDIRMWDDSEAYPVKAQLYAFVPMHNVSNLYGDANKK